MPTILLALPGLHSVRRGAETAMESLAGELARIPGWKVTVAGSGCASPGRPYEFEHVECPELSHFSRRPSLPWFRTPAQWQELAFARQLRKRLAGRTFDLTLGCSWPWTHYVLRACGHRHVFWTQNGDHMIASGRAEYATFRCDGLICTNPDYLARHSERWRSVMLPNGVDPAIFRPDESPKADGGERTALVVSALVPHKRVDRAIAAVAAVGGLRLIVCGEGPEAEALDRLAHERLPGRYERIAVPRERMPEVYRRADVLLHPCEAEPSANVWSEALSSGLPVVAHDMPVTRWVLEEHGIYVDVTDTDSLCEGVRSAIRSIETNPGDRRLRHESARSRLAWSQIGQRAAEFMQGLLPTPASDAVAPRGLGIVVIGRNEGERLRRCLRSLPQTEQATVYVDSGSTDSSVAIARQHGAAVVDLDVSGAPFTAGRARNAGLAELVRRKPEVDLVLFLDGDTELLSGFLPAAAEAMGDPAVAAVAGRRREREPDATLYNRLCEMEWNTPVPRGGLTRAVGGDAVYRVAAFRSVGGFDASLIAGEEPDLCYRLRLGGHRLKRVPLDMTLHDAAMTTFGQWWRRQVRAGHAYSEGAWIHRHEPGRYRQREVRSIVLWGGILPAAAVVSSVLAAPIAVPVCCLVIACQCARVTATRLRRGDGLRHSVLYGVMNQVGKLAQFQGVIGFHLARLRGRRVALIEYKAASHLAQPEPREQAIHLETEPFAHG